MEHRRLGRTGPVVSTLGLGAGSTTTDFGVRDDEVQVATMQRAMDLGVPLFDTVDLRRNCRNGTDHHVDIASQHRHNARGAPLYGM